MASALAALDDPGKEVFVVSFFLHEVVAGKPCAQYPVGFFPQPFVDKCWMVALVVLFTVLDVSFVERIFYNPRDDLSPPFLAVHCF
ncbi:MAG: hypothetical protein A2Y00_05370 [Omnitrophica WOR_2 bacterium GWF2_43_52]|nr:MAG: hypothetical protein A2062_05795 [Omnitrophica WOR_2 bacterium GWA2_44_7]OGX14448.1 MAG: hypothetical protein A2Y01_02115 [Omnitrophica WOR_2 bacterium GWC2_44_8]OGX20529.1 MAG: hypothetical protein A2Y00_05370 [Omnitrophica WOR_2 bacterium GWF2_43_52]